MTRRTAAQRAKAFLESQEQIQPPENQDPQTANRVPAEFSRYHQSIIKSCQTIWPNAKSYKVILKKNPAILAADGDYTDAIRSVAARQEATQGSTQATGMRRIRVNLKDRPPSYTISCQRLSGLRSGWAKCEIQGLTTYATKELAWINLDLALKAQIHNSVETKSQKRKGRLAVKQSRAETDQVQNVVSPESGGAKLKVSDSGCNQLNFPSDIGAAQTVGSIDSPH